MLFTSLNFLAFFLAFYLLYLLLQKHVTPQNVLVLAGSYLFYGFWDWRFLFLLTGVTLVSYIAGRRMAVEGARRKQWLWLGLGINLLSLGFFKYFDFFYVSLVKALHVLGLELNYVDLQIILPVGISFYTLQASGYLIDVYHKRIQPSTNLLSFAVFAAFFPQVLAGPIERASRMLPQIETRREISSDKVYAGLFLLVWGLFKKMVVADSLAVIANQVFGEGAGFGGLDVIIGALAFTIQIYADFSGYSDIARGLARLLGFELVVNFRLPYLALNPTDFWNRWHISLSSWLRDYIFFPLRRSLLRQKQALFVTIIVPTMVTMLVSGLWHGAAWHFVLWGAYHGVLLVGYQYFEARFDRWFGKVPLLKISIMFVLTVLGWIIFRANSITHLATLLTQMSLTASPHSAMFAKELLFFSAPLLLVQAYQNAKQDLLAPLNAPAYARLPLFAALLAAILIFGIHTSTEFIYFQF